MNGLTRFPLSLLRSWWNYCHGNGHGKIGGARRPCWALLQFGLVEWHLGCSSTEECGLSVRILGVREELGRASVLLDSFFVLNYKGVLASTRSWKTPTLVAILLTRLMRVILDILAAMRCLAWFMFFGIDGPKGDAIPNSRKEFRGLSFVLSLFKWLSWGCCLETFGVVKAIIHRNVECLLVCILYRID